MRNVAAPDDAPWSEKYLGVVDMSDVVVYAVSVLGKAGRPSLGAGMEGGGGTDFLRAIASKDVFARTSVTEVLRVLRLPRRARAGVRGVALRVCALA